MRKVVVNCLAFSVLSCLALNCAYVEAKTLNVQCGTTTSNPSSITSALTLLDPNVPNTLNVFGTCTENVVINRFNRLTLVGQPGSSVVDASGGTSQTILVLDSTDVVLNTMRVDGGLVAVQCDSFSVCRFTGDTIVNGGAGIQITQSRAEIDTTNLHHNQNGITSLDASSVRIDGGVILDANFNGIVVDGASALESFGATISGSNVGITASNHAHVFLSSTTVTANGDGITIVSHSNIHLFGNNSITANRRNGVALTDLSFGLFDFGNTITGNNTNGGPALDVGCGLQFVATRGALTNIGGGRTNCVEP